MSISIDGNNLILTLVELERLWDLVREKCGIEDQVVGMRYVSGLEIKKLNREYRKMDEETNVLTFSYGDGSHDIALCLKKIKAEAETTRISLKSYLAGVVTHAFLHAGGMDHEVSEAEASRMRSAEREILKEGGYEWVERR